MDAFVDNLKGFATAFGTDGVQELNSACSRHQVILAPQETTKFSYGGLLIEDGTLRLVFAEDSLACNVSEVSKDFAEAIKTASTTSKKKSPFNLIARNAVRKDYDPKIEDVRSAIARMVNMPDIKLEPNFEVNAPELAKSADQIDQDWDTRIGWITLEYFEALRDTLERQKFQEDDMLQEGFQEGVGEGRVRVRVLPQWDDNRSRYNEVVVDQGVLYIQVSLS
jgi:hypothetical protein